MKNEILSLSTATKLARYDKAIQFIEEKIKNNKEFYEEYKDDEVFRIIDLLEEILDILEVQNEQIKEN